MAFRVKEFRVPPSLKLRKGKAGMFLVDAEYLVFNTPSVSQPLCYFWQRSKMKKSTKSIFLIKKDDEWSECIFSDPSPAFSRFLKVKVELGDDFYVRSAH